MTENFLSHTLAVSCSNKIAGNQVIIMLEGTLKKLCRINFLVSISVYYTID